MPYRITGVGSVVATLLSVDEYERQKEKRYT